MRSEDHIGFSQDACKIIRGSLYANPTYEHMVKSMGLDPVVSPLNSSISTELKLWKVEGGKMDCVKTLPLFPSSSPDYITSLCVNEESDLLVLGTESGNVYAVHGNLTRMKQPKIISLTSSLQLPVTNLHIIPAEVRIVYVVLIPRNLPNSTSTQLQLIVRIASQSL